MTDKNRLIAHLQGLQESLTNDWMTVDAVMGNMLLYLWTEGYIKKDKEVYIKSL